MKLLPVRNRWLSLSSECRDAASGGLELTHLGGQKLTQPIVNVLSLASNGGRHLCALGRGNARRPLQAGFQEFLAKPFLPTALVAAIHRVRSPTR